MAMDTRLTTTNDPSQAPLNRRVEHIPLSAKATIIKGLLEDVPRNDYGLPIYIFRSDLIPFDYQQLPQEEQTKLLSAAAMQLDYSQGFPAQRNGEPFWSKLEFEPVSAYDAFCTFLQSTMRQDDQFFFNRPSTPVTRTVSRRSPQVDAHEGVSFSPVGGRENSVLHNSEPESVPTVQTDIFSPVRQLHMLAPATGLDTKVLLDFSHIFYWYQRAQAYDMFVVALHKKRREQLAMSVEGRHYEMTTRLVHQANERLQEMLENPDDHDISARELLDIVFKMAQLQRASLGLPSLNASGKRNEKEPQNAPLEVILRALTQQAGIPTNTSKQANQEDVEQLLSDPKTLANAQELIIKLNPKQVG